MRVLIQRVREASVTIDGQLFSEIGYGYLLLVGFEESDNEDKYYMDEEENEHSRGTPWGNPNANKH